MPPTPPVRPHAGPDSAKSSVSVANLDDLVAAVDRPIVDVHVATVTHAPGPALLVWGGDALCLAYNRHYRSLAGLRASALGRPLFKAQPELERAWKPKLDLAFGGLGAAVDGAAFAGGADGAGGEHHVGALVPVPGGVGGARGVLALFSDASGLVEPTRRLVGALAHDLREPLVSIQVVAERLLKLSKPSRERCFEDMERVLTHTAQLDRLVDDMGAYARRSNAAGARLSLRPGDLGAIVRAACEVLAAQPGRPIRVSVAEVSGLWDDDAIGRILAALVASARLHGEGDVGVELTAGRDGAVLTVKDDGPGPRGEDAEQLFEPWKRGGAPAAERRRRGLGLGLFLARELVIAHGGRIQADRAAGGGFAVRVLLPISGHGSSGPSSRSLRSAG